MSIVLFDSKRESLFPLTLNKAIGALEFGLFSVKERWERLSSEPVYLHTADDLQDFYALIPQEEHLWVDARVLINQSCFDQIFQLKTNQVLVDSFGLVAVRIHTDVSEFHPSKILKDPSLVKNTNHFEKLAAPWDLVKINQQQIEQDFQLVTKGRASAPIPAYVKFTCPENIFLEEGVLLEHCHLNASAGPIYLGKSSLIMDGASLRGPLSLGEGSVVKMNSRIYGASSFGKHCTLGGEIKQSVMMSFSNKAHDGYLGDAVVGAWCNFGAGACNSNVKNNASEIKIWHMGEKQSVSVGNKFGLVMGDYTKVAIQSAINTGSMIGLSCHVFGEGLLPTILPNFSWGVKGESFEFPKAIESIRNWKLLKGERLSEKEIKLLENIYFKNQSL